MAKTRKILCLVLTCIMLVCGTSVHAQAANEDYEVIATFATERASGKFSMEVSANKIVKASSSFPMEAGEKVRINASYTPDASVDFGLIDPNGVFHYYNVTNGSIDKTIRIEERGTYTFAVRNNSSKAISVSGYVNY